MKKLLVFLILILGTASLQAQYDGIWEGYDGEWDHVSRQLTALAEATPQDKFGWRPAPGAVDERGVYAYRFGQFLPA